MDKFKPSKGKALARATANEVNQKAEIVVEQLVDKWPQGAVALAFVQASFGLMLGYKQEVLNQFTEYLMNHSEVFTPNNLTSQEFHDGLYAALNSYFKLRTDEKREIAERIFYDFGKSAEKPLYPLERYDDTLEKISQAGIRLLGFIDQEVPHIKEKYVANKMRSNSNSQDEENIEKMAEVYTTGKTLSDWVEEYVKEKADRESPKRNGETWIVDLEGTKRRIRDEIYLGFGELEQLGLIRFQQGVTTWGGDQGGGYNLTDYGLKFLTVIRPTKDN